jgi:asparagine synthetase B (glutamine-hydrolysing)
MYEALNAYAHHAPEVSRAEAALLAHIDYTLCWLLQRADANLMQHAVEGRVPFLGHDVVRLVLNLPLASRIGPLSKGILRDVAASMLPAAIADRPKVAGMDFDAGGWIDEAADPAFLHDGILREVLRVPDTELRRVMATENGRLRMRVWSAEIWCRSVFAGHPQAQIEAELWRA